MLTGPDVSTGGHPLAPVIPHIAPPGRLDVHSVDTAEEWKLWRQVFENYLVLSGVENKPETVKVALFENCVGLDALRMVNSLKYQRDDDRKVLANVMRKFEEVLVGERKEFFQRFKFNRRNQETEESIEQYVAVLRNMAKSCGFCDCMYDKLLMDRLILGVRDEKLREKLISQKSLDLQSAIDLCKSLEIASVQLKEMKEVEGINAVTNKTSFKGSSRPTYGGKSVSGRRNRPSLSKAQESLTGRCKFCCKSHEFRKELCPAWGKQCNKCGNKNHFSVSLLCRANKGKVNALQASRDSDESSSDAEQIYVVETVCSLPHSKKGIYCTMVINGQNVRMQIDCGATVNVLPARYVDVSEIVPDSVTLQMWDKSTMKSLGKCKIKTINPRNGLMYNVKYVVVKDDSVLVPLISAKAAVKMGLITINYDQFQSVNVVNAELSFCDAFP